MEREWKIPLSTPLPHPPECEELAIVLFQTSTLAENHLSEANNIYKKRMRSMACRVFFASTSSTAVPQSHSKHHSSQAAAASSESDFY